MSRWRFLPLAALAFTLTACQTTTSTLYRVAGASGHRERMQRLLRNFAQREMMTVVPPTESTPRAVFVHYRNSLGTISLQAIDQKETIQVRLSELQSFGNNPSGSFDSLEQKLRNELAVAFGTDVHYETIVTRGPQ